MDYEKRIESNPRDTILLIEYANILYNKKEYVMLEQLFVKHLNATYNIELWEIYLKYVKNNKKVDLEKVYEYILDRFEFHWDVYPVYVDYIKELEKIEDEQTRIDKIRTTYHRSFRSPINCLNILWKNYETFELELNKVVGNQLISDTLPIYHRTFELYQVLNEVVKYDRVKGYKERSIKDVSREIGGVKDKNSKVIDTKDCTRSYNKIQNFITFDMFYRIIDIELENIARLDNHGERMNFLFNFFIDRFYYKEEVHFLYSEYLIERNLLPKAIKVISDGLSIIRNSIFLTCYLSSISNKDIFKDTIAYLIENKIGECVICSRDVNNKSNSVTSFNVSNASNGLDLLMINYLSSTLKIKGLEEMRGLFESFKDGEVGPYVYIYVALTSYYNSRDKKSTYSIFNEGLKRFKDNSECLKIVEEYFFMFYLSIGEEREFKALFKRIDKNDRMWRCMIDYEYKYGNITEFRNYMGEYVKSLKGNRVKDGFRESFLTFHDASLDISPGEISKSYTLYESYVRSFEFLDLKMVGDLRFINFCGKIPNLNKKENLFSTIKLESVLNILRDIIIE